MLNLIDRLKLLLRLDRKDKEGKMIIHILHEPFRVRKIEHTENFISSCPFCLQKPIGMFANVQKKEGKPLTYDDVITFSEKIDKLEEIK